MPKKDNAASNSTSDAQAQTDTSESTASSNGTKAASGKDKKKSGKSGKKAQTGGKAGKAKGSTGKQSKAGGKERSEERHDDQQDQHEQGEESRKVRYAVIGLGHIAQSAVLPAFAHARRNSELAALVSDTPRKLRDLGSRYGVEALYDYDGLMECLHEEDVDAVYIATPNTEHIPFVIDAARAGKHVLCEKPLGVSERECMEMIEACEEAGVHLMTAYRLHFEAANLGALEVVHSGEIGEPRIFTSAFTMQVTDESNYRLQAELGGGPLYDIGVYCINAARGVFRDEPIEVHAWQSGHDDDRFREVYQTVTAMLRFPGDRVATFVCSFGAADTSWYEVVGDRGSVRVDPAYEISEGLGFKVVIDGKKRPKRFARRDQFAAELLYFSECVLNDEPPEPSGWEGLADVRVIRALIQSIERDTALELPPSPQVMRYADPRQRIDRPPVREQRLVGARSATGDD